MTKEELFEEYKGYVIILTGKYAKTMPQMSFDDIRQIGYQGLLKGIHSFNKDITPYASTHLWTCIENELKRRHAYENAQCRKVVGEVGSYPYVQLVHGEDVTFEVPGPYTSPEEQAIANTVYQQAMGLLTDKEQEFLRDWLVFNNGSAVGKKYGITRQAVQQRIDRIISKIRNKLN